MIVCQQALQSIVKALSTLFNMISIYQIMRSHEIFVTALRSGFHQCSPMHVTVPIQCINLVQAITPYRKLHGAGKTIPVVINISLCSLGARAKELDNR